MMHGGYGVTVWESVQVADLGRLCHIPGLWLGWGDALTVSPSAESLGGTSWGVNVAECVLCSLESMERGDLVY